MLRLLFALPPVRRGCCGCLVGVVLSVLLTSLVISLAVAWGVEVAGAAPAARPHQATTATVPITATARVRDPAPWQAQPRVTGSEPLVIASPVPITVRTAQPPALISRVLTAPPAAWPSSATALLAAGVVLAGALLVGGSALAWRRGKRAPATLGGVLHLADTETGAACTALLYAYPQGAVIRRSPLALTALSQAGASIEDGIARLLPDPRGPLLVALDGKEVSSPVLLESEQRYPLANGAVVLRFISG
jgi:hypothetical protein